MEGVITLYLFIALGFIINLVCFCTGIKTVEKDDIVARPYDRLYCDDVFEIIIAGKSIICLVEESTAPSKLMIKFRTINYKNDMILIMNMRDLIDYKYRFIGTIGTFHYLLCA